MRHISLTLGESAGVFQRAFGLGSLSQGVPFDPSQSYIPTTDFFDNRTYYLTTQVDLRIQKTARLSFNLGGNNFLTRYRAKGLVGTTGLGARGDRITHFEPHTQEPSAGWVAGQTVEFSKTTKAYHSWPDDIQPVVHS
jgi:hypothetical protein